MSVEKDLKQLRPRIDEVNPVVAKGILGFGIFNILLGFSLFIRSSRFQGDVILFNYLLDYQLWGVLFFVLGCLMLYYYFTNDWNWMRRTQLIAVFLKSVWLFALIFRFFADYDNSILLIIWGFIAYIQILFYVFYTPPKVT